jgi:hypothetical protein
MHPPESGFYEQIVAPQDSLVGRTASILLLGWIIQDFSGEKKVLEKGWTLGFSRTPRSFSEHPRNDILLYTTFELIFPVADHLILFGSLKIHTLQLVLMGGFPNPAS